MLKVIFTLDYEIHGNGEGCARKLMTEPTERMLRLFDQYGARLTIMADIAEILKFKQYAQEHKRDDYDYDGIVSQLRDAVARGHDAQLHIHSSYFNATHDGRQWVQCWEDYDFANLSLERMTGMIRQGKEFLESTLKPVNPNYRCIAFRAANWSVSPSKNVVKALLDNGIEIDTSVFKYGRRDGRVKFDYSGAWSNLVPWRAGQDDLCVRDDRGRLWEFPIYSENRWIGAFLTPNRLFRVAQSRAHTHQSDTVVAGNGHTAQPAPKRTLLDRVSSVAKGHAWKADFNQCTGGQLIGALLRAERQAAPVSGDVPFVLIGHSKLFNSLNESSLRPFLEFVAQNKDRFDFGTFGLFRNGIEHQNDPAVCRVPGVPQTVDASPAGVRRSYVLVTPARNEQGTIEATINSVVSQTVPPREWIIVSDRSTDQTDEIVKRYAASHGFIRLVRIDGHSEHSFAALVRATEAGLKALRTKDYAYLGLLDADVRFPPDYYEKLMTEFESDPKLGVGGGMVLDAGETVKRAYQNLNEVAGATQFFSRACFESLGGLWAIPEGGWDAITCVRARMNGYRTATFPSVVMDHLKPRNASQGNWWSRNLQLGVRDYAMGNHPAFELAKCCNRLRESPFFGAAIARLSGFVQSALEKRKRLITPEIVNYVQREQLQRLSVAFQRKPAERETA